MRTLLVRIVITVVEGVLSAGVCVALRAGALKHSLLESPPLPSEDRGGEGGGPAVCVQVAQP